MLTVPPSLLIRILEEIYSRVEKLGSSPVVSGGLAVSYWGHPRSTQDIDLAVLIANAARFERELRSADLQPLVNAKSIDLGFVQVSQWLFTSTQEHIDCKIDFLISHSKYFRTAIHRAIPCDFPGVSRPLLVLSCEDLLLFKAASGRLIDLADIKTLYALHHNRLDHDYLLSQSTELGLPKEYWTRN